MKKLLLFFIAATLISCGSKDDDDTERTTDPLIGVWNTSEIDGDEVSLSWTVKSNGTYTLVSLNDEVELSSYNSATWTNIGNDFNSLTQTYRTIVDGESSLTTINFADDFNSFTSPDDEFGMTWRRQ